MNFTYYLFYLLKYIKMNEYNPNLSQLIADPFACDSLPQSARVNINDDNAKYEMLLSDVIRRSKLAEDQQFNNSVKSPFLNY